MYIKSDVHNFIISSYLIFLNPSSTEPTTEELRDLK